MWAEFRRVRTHGLIITQNECIFKLEVLHGALLPKTHRNQSKKKTLSLRLAESLGDHFQHVPKPIYRKPSNYY